MKMYFSYKAIIFFLVCISWKISKAIVAVISKLTVELLYLNW